MVVVLGFGKIYGGEIISWLSYIRDSHLSTQKESFVADVPSFSSTGLSWNIDFSRLLFDREVPMIAHLIHLLNGVFISSNDNDVHI